MLAIPTEPLVLSDLVVSAAVGCSPPYRLVSVPEVFGAHAVCQTRVVSLCSLSQRAFSLSINVS